MWPKLLNFHEGKTSVRLKKICEENGAVVYPKVRVADVLPIQNSGISADDYSFALKSHFDFVVADSTTRPLFAVEFDGPTHKQPEQKARDARKNRLCERFGFPLLRINSRYLDDRYRGMDLLSWFVEVWFMRTAFNEAQERGDIPPDEIFDAWCVVTDRSGKISFPFWLSAPALVKLRRLAEAGKIRDPVMSRWVGRDKDGNYRAIGWIAITAKLSACVQTGMRSQLFPVMETEVIDELLAIEIYDLVTRILKGEAKAESREAVKSKVTALRRATRLVSAGGSDLPAFGMADLRGGMPDEGAD